MSLFIPLLLFFHSPSVPIELVPASTASQTASLASLHISTAHQIAISPALPSLLRCTELNRKTDENATRNYLNNYVSHAHAAVNALAIAPLARADGLLCAFPAARTDDALQQRAANMHTRSRMQ